MPQYDFSLIDKAGLTQKEFAELCSVSRVTVNLWVSSKMSPHRYIRERVAEALDTVAQALGSGRLPLSDELPRDERPAALSAALAKTADLT